MNKRKAILSCTALLLALVAATLIIPRLGGGAPPGVSDKAYFYDLNTGELFVASADAAPPIDAPSGPLRNQDGAKAGVRAYVFTCGQDTDADRHIAWIETTMIDAQGSQTPSGQTHSHPLMQAEQASSMLVARINPVQPWDVTWFPAGSPMGAELPRNASRPCPDGSAPRLCLP